MNEKTKAVEPALIEKKCAWIETRLHARAAVVAKKRRRSIEGELNTCVEIGLQKEEQNRNYGF